MRPHRFHRSRETSRFARRVLHVLLATLYRSARDYRRTVPVDPTWQECSLFPPPPRGVSRYRGRREEAPNPSPRGCQKRWPPESASCLCRPLFSGLKIEGGTNTKLIQEAIFSGNLWGLDWGLPRVFHDTETPPEVVGETGYILAMWDRLEQSFDNLAPSDKEWLAKHAEPFGRNVRFPGFDGNDEASYINAARFLIDSLERFQHFKGRDLNAHMPTLAAHRRMLSIFDPILQQVLHRDLNAAQIAEVVAA